MQFEKVTSGRRTWRVATAVTVVVAVGVLYRWGGVWPTQEDWQGMTPGGGAAVAIILAMTFAWAFALPASAFLFVTPLLFPPHLSTLITTTGCAFGSAAGYLAARFIGGAWIERFRDGRLRRFLTLHSSFLSLFGIRLTPSSPHGFINYAAGLAGVPLARFVSATAAAMAIKSYVYATAIHGTLGAKSLTDALSARTLLSLFAVSLLALTGHVLQRRFMHGEPAPLPVAK